MTCFPELSLLTYLRKKMKRCITLSSVFLVLLMFCLAGCDAGKPRNSRPVTQDPPVVAEEPAAPVAEPERELVDIGRDPSGRAAFAEGQGETLMSPILVPLGQYFSVQDRIADMRRQDAMNKYKAMNDNKPPATHEEYMREIIEANNIKLSPLKNSDDKYQYDPASGELKILTRKR